MCYVLYKICARDLKASAKYFKVTLKIGIIIQHLYGVGSKGKMNVVQKRWLLAVGFGSGLLHRKDDI